MFRMTLFSVPVSVSKPSKGGCTRAAGLGSEGGRCIPQGKCVMSALLYKRVLETTVHYKIAGNLT